MSDYCTTPEERQEVAAKLRENSTAAHNAEEMLHIICKCTVRAMKGSKGVMRVLADLIDPTCHMDWTYWDGDELLDSYMDNITGTPEDTAAYHCRACDEIFRYERHDIPNYCPCCGARVVKA